MKEYIDMGFDSRYSSTEAEAIETVTIYRAMDHPVPGFLSGSKSTQANMPIDDDVVQRV